MEYDIIQLDYNCSNCGEEWTTEWDNEQGEFPEEYKCPLCTMPLWQMLKETWKEGGLKEVFYHLKKRYGK